MPDVSPAVGKEFLFRRHQGHFCLVHKGQNKRPNNLAVLNTACKRRGLLLL